MHCYLCKWQVNGIQYNTTLVESLAEGFYDITATDSNGCVSPSMASVILTDPDGMQFY